MKHFFEKNRANHSRLALFFLASVLWGSSTLLALQVPERPDGYVTDKAGMLSPSIRAQLEKNLAYFENQTTNQVVVVTFPSLEGQVLEDFSIRLAEKWKIGQKGRNNGVIFLIFKDDRKMRIEVGYGLEGALTDALASKIINNEVAPFFKEGNYDQGIASGVNAILQATRGEYRALSPRSGNSKDDTLSTLSIVIFFIFLIIVMVMDMIRYIAYRFKYTKRRHLYSFWEWWFLFSWLHALTEGSSSSGGSWSSSSGGSSGGGFSGGGGSFGGGGASGGW